MDIIDQGAFHGAMCWGNNYQTNLNKICTKQNKCIRSIFFAKKQEPSLPYYQILEIWKFENIVKFKICSLAFKLYNNPSTVPAIFHNFLTPTSTVHSYNTRNSAKLNFYRPQVRTNIGKFTFQYSASVMWEAVHLALKKANTLTSLRNFIRPTWSLVNQVIYVLFSGQMYSNYLIMIIELITII